MADPIALKKQIDDLNEELNKTLQQVQDIGSSIGMGMRKQLIDTTEKTRQFAEQLLKSKDLSKDISKISSELTKSNIKNTQLSIEKNIAQQKLNDLLTKGSTLDKKSYDSAIRKLKNDLVKNSLALQLHQSTEDELRTLLKIAEEEAKITAEKKKQNSLVDLAKNKIKEIAKSFTLAAIFKQLLDFVLAADTQVTELAKSLGLSKDQARGIRDNFASYAKSTGDAFVTTKKLMEAQGDLTQELGVAGTYTGKQTEDFSRLTKLLGLSVGEAGKLARLSVINGTSIEDTTKSIIKGSFAAGRTNKLSVDQRTILKEVANLSEGILVKFQGNPEALGAAVVQAKALGLNLEQVDKIGDSLLNFESSIENELKAELITGKQINLEKARAAALTGDQAALAAEVASQVGNLNDFSKMNVIAQQSLAEAFGMNRDEMSKMLMDQEKFNRLGDVSSMTAQEQLALAKEKGISVEDSLYQSLQQQSSQEKFNNAIEKLQDLIGNLVAGPFGQLIDGFASIAGNATLIKIVMGALVGMSITRLVTGLAAMVIPLITGAAASVTMMSALTLGIGAIAILGSIAAISSSMNKSKEEMSQKPQQVKDGTAFSSRGPFTITDDYGATAITAEGDGLAVSPNINRGGGSDLTPMVAAINNLATSMSKPTPTPQFSLNVAGEQLGNVVGRQQETGTQQSKNTYKLA